VHRLNLVLYQVLSLAALKVPESEVSLCLAASIYKLSRALQLAAMPHFWDSRVAQGPSK